MKKLRLERVSETFARLALSRSAGYAQIKSGLLPPPVPISDRAVAIPSNEVDAIIAARIAGKSNEQIRTLVTDLVAARTRAAG